MYVNGDSRLKNRRELDEQKKRGKCIDDFSRLKYIIKIRAGNVYGGRIRCSGVARRNNGYTYDFISRLRRGRKRALSERYTAAFIFKFNETVDLFFVVLSNVKQLNLLYGVWQ